MMERNTQSKHIKNQSQFNNSDYQFLESSIFFKITLFAEYSAFRAFLRMYILSISSPNFVFCSSKILAALEARKAVENREVLI